MFYLYFILQIYPVTREWDEANWLDPFLGKLLFFFFLHKNSIFFLSIKWLIPFCFVNKRRHETKEMYIILLHPRFAHVPQPPHSWLVEALIEFGQAESGWKPQDLKCLRCQHILRGSMPTAGQHMQNTRVRYACLETVFVTISQYEDRNTFSL